MKPGRKRAGSNVGVLVRAPRGTERQAIRTYIQPRHLNQASGKSPVTTIKASAKG